MYVRRMWPVSPFTRAGVPNPARLRHDMDRLFDMLRTDFADQPSPAVFPAMNVTQDDDNYYVRAELPGVGVDNLDISVERNKMSISGKREIPAESDGVSYHRRERMGGSFSRSIALPEDLKSDAVEATYTDGVLTITLPKAEAVKARQIKIKAG